MHSGAATMVNVGGRMAGLQYFHCVKYHSVDDFLVGGFNPSEKYEFVSWDDYSQLNGKSSNSCSKPPSSFHPTKCP